MSCLNVKIPDKTSSSHILDKASRLTYGELLYMCVRESWDRFQQKCRRISMGTKRLYYSHEGNHLPAENGIHWICVDFSDYCVWHTFVLLSIGVHLCRTNRNG